MSDNKSDDRIKEIEKFKNNNSSTFLELKKMLEDGKKELFKEHCLKKYLTECEPEYCIYRIIGKCKYPEEYTKLKNAGKIY